MRSNLKITLIVSFVLASLSSCGPSQNQNKNTGSENVIGQNLEAITSLRTSDGSQKQTIALFDETIKKIHQFDLNLMSVDRALPVLYPNAKHYVLYSGASNYIVDLSEKHISIFDKNSVAQHEPIHFQGVPQSAAFRPDLGWLVVYDNLQSVGVVKLSSDGQVLDSHTFGSVVDADKSIVSGDLNDDGNLILSLSDNSIAIVNLETIMSSKPKHWSSVIQPTTLENISWIAPINGSANKILMKTINKVVLYDITTASILSSIDITSSNVIKLSKNFNPHVVVSTSTSSIDLIYTDGMTLLKRTFNLVAIDQSSHYLTEFPILNSDLDINNDNWTCVYYNSSSGFSLFNDVNQKKTNRQLIRYRLSDKLALQTKVIKDNYQVKLGADYYFELSPSKIGYALKNSIIGDSVQEMSGFNLNKY